MNLRNWRNWGTNLAIRLGFRDQFAHAFAEQDYYVKETEEKEVSLLPTFLEWSFGNPFRNLGNPKKWSIGSVKLFGGGSKGGGGGGGGTNVQAAIDAATAKAKKEAEERDRENQRARDKMTAEIAALKAKQAERQGRATASASALRIVGGAKRDTTAKAKKKAARRADVGTTSREIKLAGAPGQVGAGQTGPAYGSGQPVL